MLLFSRVELFYEGYILQGKARWPKCSDIVPKKISNPPPPVLIGFSLQASPFSCFLDFQNVTPHSLQKFPVIPEKNIEENACVKFLRKQIASILLNQ